jgi:hypothetical protein
MTHLKKEMSFSLAKYASCRETCDQRFLRYKRMCSNLGSFLRQKSMCFQNVGS